MSYQLKDKNILVISPQSWGNMFLTKHHYSVELAKNNNVFFLSPPYSNKYINAAIRIRKSADVEKLWIIDHSLGFPFWLKFKLPGLFHLCMKSHIKKLLRSINVKLDIVWSFDLGNLYPLKFFPLNTLKIFHPVDEPGDKMALKAADSADVIFSVTNEILSKYHFSNAPKHVMNHGVIVDFFVCAQKEDDSVNVGLSGNFLRADIDRPVLLKIISENPSVKFHLWGSYRIEQSNIAGNEDRNTKLFIESLMNKRNVIFYGPVSPTVLAEAFSRVDAFLICYDINLDQSKGTNYHKIMEYLSTGKVIIANNVSAYKKYRNLICMVDERTDNNKLPDLFKSVMNNLAENNRKELREERIDFAKENTYARQIEKIEVLLNSYNNS